MDEPQSNLDAKLSLATWAERSSKDLSINDFVFFTGKTREKYEVIFGRLLSNARPEGRSKDDFF